MNLVKIKTPIWHDKWNKTGKMAIGIAERELTKDNDPFISVVVEYKKKDKKPLLPNTLYIPKCVVQTYPFIKKINTDIFIVPLTSFQERN
jgi:hypothetical protein